MNHPPLVSGGHPQAGLYVWAPPLSKGLPLPYHSSPVTCMDSLIYVTLWSSTYCIVHHPEQGLWSHITSVCSECSAQVQNHLGSIYLKISKPITFDRRWRWAQPVLTLRSVGLCSLGLATASLYQQVSSHCFFLPDSWCPTHQGPLGWPHQVPSYEAGPLLRPFCQSQHEN